MNDRHQQIRLIEALLFASAEPLDEVVLKSRLPEGADVTALVEELTQLYANRGVHVVQVGKKWAFRTAPDLAAFLKTEQVVARKLNRATVETLAVIAYHQPVTRPEIEEIRGVSLSRGTLDVLLESGWVKPGRRKEGPGRPVTWVTTEGFLDHFGFASVKDLPGIEELKAAGLLDKRPAIAAYGATLTEEQLADQDAEREAALEEAERLELSLEEIELAAEDAGAEPAGEAGEKRDNERGGGVDDGKPAGETKAEASAALEDREVLPWEDAGSRVEDAEGSESGANETGANGSGTKETGANETGAEGDAAISLRVGLGSPR
jgi:segregation and condensation protein B